MINSTEQHFLNRLRREGYLVVIYAPSELEGIDRDTLEASILNDAADTIEWLQDTER
jgi:hypothetical protein